MRPNKIKQALAEGKTVIGCAFNTIRSPEVARILAAAGFDYAYLDAEHGAFDFETIHDIARAADDAGLTPLVRVADLQYSLVARALDNGAMGVIFPRVESREILERAVSWCRFPPDGVRGFGITPSHLQVRYQRASIGDVARHINENTLVVLQIETALAVERRDELLSVPGLDVVMIGPVDLSISLGVPGDFFHPKMEEAIEKIRDSALAHGVAPGIQTRPIELAKKWMERGMRFVGCGAETGMLLQGARSIVEALRA